MNNNLFLLSAALFFSSSAVQAMDTLPSEVIERGVIPQMDRESLETYGSTNQKNAAAIKKHREDEAQPKDAVMACPPVSEVLQALTTDTPKTIEAVAIPVIIFAQEDLSFGAYKWRGVVMKKKTSEETNTDIPDSLKAAQLMQITFDHRETAGAGGSQRISCLYRPPYASDSTETITISRPLLRSQWRVIFQTCKPTNPAYEQSITLENMGIYPVLGETITMKPIPGTFLPNNFQVICEQQKKEG